MLKDELYNRIYKIIFDTYKEYTQISKNEEMASKEIGIYFYGNPAIKLHLFGKRQFIWLKNKYSDKIETLHKETIESDKLWTKVFLNNVSDLDNISNIILEIYEDMANIEFDCCSRYEECSDNKKCVNPYRHLMMTCGYRKILMSGKVFYGKNRNIK